jgi:uncharacterized membrane protein (UPF0136 family)
MTNYELPFRSDTGLLAYDLQMQQKRDEEWAASQPPAPAQGSLEENSATHAVAEGFAGARVRPIWSLEARAYLMDAAPDWEELPGDEMSPHDDWGDDDAWSVVLCRAWHRHVRDGFAHGTYAEFLKCRWREYGEAIRRLGRPGAMQALRLKPAQVLDQEPTRPQWWYEDEREDVKAIRDYYADLTGEYQGFPTYEDTVAFQGMFAPEELEVPEPDPPASIVAADNPLFDGPGGLGLAVPGYDEEVGVHVLRAVPAGAVQLPTRAQAIKALDLALGVGACVSCALAAVMPQAGGACMALECAHAAVAAVDHAFLMSHRVETARPTIKPVSGEEAAFDFDQLVAALGMQPDDVAQLSAVVNLTATMVFAVRAGHQAPAAAVAAVVSGVASHLLGALKFLTAHQARTAAEGLAMGLVAAVSAGGETAVPTMLEFLDGARYSGADVIKSALSGLAHGQVPTWLSYLAVLTGKLLGLSMAASAVSWLVPEYVVQFCKDAKCTVGSLAFDVLEGVSDLVARSSEAWAAGSLRPLFESRSKHEAVMAAHALIATLPDHIPGTGSGDALVHSRLSHMEAVREAVCRA